MFILKQPSNTDEAEPSKAAEAGNKDKTGQAPSKSTGESSNTAESGNKGKTGQASPKTTVKSTGEVRTKVSICVPDESDGGTSLGKVEYVRKAKYDTRVIVNRGTENNPYFEIYPGADFGKGVARD